MYKKSDITKKNVFHMPNSYFYKTPKSMSNAYNIMRHTTYIIIYKCKIHLYVQNVSLLFPLL